VSHYYNGTCTVQLTDLEYQDAEIPLHFEPAHINYSKMQFYPQLHTDCCYAFLLFYTYRCWSQEGKCYTVTWSSHSHCSIQTGV